MCLPDGLKTHIPPGPVAKIYPLLFIHIPSGRPFSLPAKGVASKRIFPFESFPSASISYSAQIARAGSELATYNFVPSLERIIPFGLVNVSISNSTIESDLIL